jgi:hypothetical protein
MINTLQNADLGDFRAGTGTILNGVAQHALPGPAMGQILLQDVDSRANLRDCSAFPKWRRPAGRIYGALG